MNYTNCLYCHKECVLIGHMSRCMGCLVDYHFDHHNIKCNINGKTYTIQYRDPEFSYDFNTVIYSNKGTIYKSTDKLNITPFNIKSKLPTILVFS